MNKFFGFLVLATPLLTASCATIANGTTQNVSIQAVANGSSVPSASCNVHNKKSSVTVTAPMTVLVNHSSDDLVVTCSQPSYGTNTVKTAPDVSGWVAGNLLIGGFIGIIVDFTDGAAYKYPSSVTVPLAAPAKPIT